MQIGENSNNRNDQKSFSVVLVAEYLLTPFVKNYFNIRRSLEEDSDIVGIKITPFI